MADPKAKPSQKKLKSNSDLKASNSNVVQQAKLMDSAGTAWHAVKYGNLEVGTETYADFGCAGTGIKGCLIGKCMFDIQSLLLISSHLTIHYDVLCRTAHHQALPESMQCV